MEMCDLNSSCDEAARNKPTLSLDAWTQSNPEVTVSRRLDPAWFWTLTDTLRTPPLCPSSWCMVETDFDSTVKNAKCQTPQRGRRGGDIISGRGTLSTCRGL